MLLRSKFTDEKQLVYLHWNDRDRARHEPEMNATIASRSWSQPLPPSRRNR